MYILNKKDGSNSVPSTKTKASEISGAFFVIYFKFERFLLHLITTFYL